MVRRWMLGAVLALALGITACGGGSGTLSIDNQLCTTVCPRTFTVTPQSLAGKLAGDIAEVRIVIDNKGSAMKDFAITMSGITGMAAAGATVSFYQDSTPVATFALRGDTPVITMASVPAASTVSLHFMLRVSNLAKAEGVSVGDVKLTLSATDTATGAVTTAGTSATVMPTATSVPVSVPAVMCAVTAELFRDATTGYYDLIVKAPDLAVVRSIGLLRPLADNESIVGVYVNSDATGWDVNDNNTVAVRSTYGAPILNGTVTIRRIPADLVGIILSKKGYAVAGGWQLSAHVMTPSGYIVPIYFKPRGVGGEYVPACGLTVTK